MVDPDCAGGRYHPDVVENVRHFGCSLRDPGDAAALSLEELEPVHHAVVAPRLQDVDPIADQPAAVADHLLLCEVVGHLAVQLRGEVGVADEGIPPADQPGDLRVAEGDRWKVSHTRNAPAA